MRKLILILIMFSFLNQPFLLSFDDTLDVATPAGTDDPTQGDDRIRELKRAFVERLAVDHTIPASGSTYDGATIGYHKAIRLPEGTAPTTPASYGSVYTKDSGTQPELFFREESDGDEVQITQNGILKNALTTQGDLLYHNGTVPTRLAKGTAYQHLRINSEATAPEWAATPEVVTGTYSGNGSDDRNITIGFSDTSKTAKMVIVTTATGFGAGMIAGMTNGYVANGSSQANGIQSISTANQFQVGTDSSVNTNGTAYKFIAWG